jgi:outer membrane protein, heavy metal efflux system
MFRIITILFTQAFAALTNQFATENVSVHLEPLIEETLKNNPEIKAAEQRWKSAQEKVSPSRALPDPMLIYSHQKTSMREKMYGVKQEIPFPTKLWLKGNMAEAEAEMREQELYATKRQVIAELKETFYELCLTYQTQNTLRKNEKILLQLKTSAEAHYKVGHGAQQDLYRAQTELSRLQARMATLEQRKTSITAAINRILNRPISTPLGEPKEIQPKYLKASLEKLTTLIADNAPVLKARQKEVKKAEEGAKLAKNGYLPNFEISAGRMREEPMDKKGYQVMVGVQIPLYAPFKQQPNIRAASAANQASTHNLQTTQQELLFRLKDSYAQIQRSEELISILRDAIIPQAELTFSSAQASYSVAKVDFLTVLNSLLTLQENEIELHMEIIEHEKSRARIEEIVGPIN